MKQKRELPSPNMRAGRILEGYAAQYNVSTDLGPFKERIRPGAFAEADMTDVRFLVDHSGIPMGRTKAGTLEVWEDVGGLRYRVVLPDTERANELQAAVERGDITQSSFAFTIAEETWDTTTGTRIIDKVGAVLDVSAVGFPAYETTTITTV